MIRWPDVMRGFAALGRGLGWATGAVAGQHAHCPSTGGDVPQGGCAREARVHWTTQPCAKPATSFMAPPVPARGPADTPTRRRMKPSHNELCCGECHRFGSCLTHPADTEAFAQVMRAHGFYLDGLTPMMMHSLLRGRTTWLVGDAHVRRRPRIPAGGVLLLLLSLSWWWAVGRASLPHVLYAAVQCGAAGPLLSTVCRDGVCVGWMPGRRLGGRWLRHTSTSTEPPATPPPPPPPPVPQQGCRVVTRKHARRPPPRVCAPGILPTPMPPAWPPPPAPPGPHRALHGPLHPSSQMNHLFYALTCFMRPLSALTHKTPKPHGDRPFQHDPKLDALWRGSVASPDADSHGCADAQESVCIELQVCACAASMHVCALGGKRRCRLVFSSMCVWGCCCSLWPPRWSKLIGSGGWCVRGSAHVLCVSGAKGATLNAGAATV